MSITLRNIKGSPLTHEEMDENFSALTSSLGAGDGLTGGGFLTSEVEFNVGQGDGITVGPDSVGVDATVARTGSNVFVGDQTITGSVYLTGSLVHDGIINLLPTEPPSPSSDPESFIYVSGSEGDLYFRQTSTRGTNETKLRWLEGNLFSGILSGGVISGTPGGTTFSVGAGSGIIVDLNASTGSLDLYPIITKVEWDDFSNITPTYLNTNDTTWLLIDSSGTLVQQTNPPTDAQYNSTITLGAVIHPNKTTINLFKTFPLTSYALAQQTYEFIRVFGPIKKSGHIISPGASSLTVSRSSGTAFALGRNYVNNPNEPSLITDDAKSEATIYRYYQSGSEFVTVPNNATIDPTRYNTPSTATGLTTAAGGQYTIQRVFFFPDAPDILAVYYGREVYNSIAAALENLNFEDFVEISNTIEQAIFLGYIIVKANATDLTNEADALFLQSGNFRATVTSGGGGSPTVAGLNDLSDVSLASLQVGDLLVYNGAEWQNRKNNLKITGSFSGSFQGTTIDVTSASFDRVDVLGSSTINGDLTVDGKVIAQEFHTEFVSASIIYQSGSTKFGDTFDDIHEFTGSVNITGSLTSIGATTLTGDVDLTGNLNVDGDITGSSNLDIAGTVDANVYSINGTTVVDSSRNITGSAGTFSGTVDVSNLDSTNNVNANTFSINGSTVINSSQDITGASLDVTGEVEGNSVAIDGTTVIDASRNITGASLDVTGEVEGNSFAINTTTVIDSSQNITGTSLDVTGNADANTFSIDGSTVIDASENITGASLDVTGEVEGNSFAINTNTVIDSSQNITGASLDVTGEVEGNTFAVDGTVIVDASRNFTGSNAEFSGDLLVEGNTTLGNADADRVDILGETIALSGSNITLQHDSPNGEFRIQTLGGTNNKLILSSSGDIEIEQSMTMKNLETSFQSVGYLSGFTGQGFDINFASQSSAEFDNLTVRGSMRVFELIINQIRATNGSLFVSSVGKVDSVIDLGTTDGQGRQEFALIFDTGSGDIGHGFVENDVIRAQRVNRNAIAEPGTTQSIDGNLVYRSDLTVTSVQDLKLVTASLSPGTTIPSSSFEFVRLGNTTNVNRQGNVYLTSDDNYAPFIDVVDGITDHSDWNNSAVSGGVKVRVGKIDGVNSPEFGDLTGYGMWASGSVYLEGSINATGGLVGGWAIEPGYLESNNIKLQSSGSAGGELISIGATAGIASNGIFLSGSGEFNLQLDSDNRITQSGGTLDLRAENLIAKGDSVEISGSNFHLLNGNITASNVDLSGNINAQTGTIGGFIIDTNLTATSGLLTLEGQTGEITGSQVLFTGGKISGSNLEINVENFTALGNSVEISGSNFHLLNGNITASNVDLSGNINAQTGTIGGFNIDADLQASSGLLTLKGASGEITGSQVLFTGGKISGSNLEINVENFTALGNSVEISGSNFHLLNGNITASNVDLSGNINAQTGTIGGFTITEDALSSSNFYLSGSATGNEFFISASNFNVKANGDLTASNANITGDIVANNITATTAGNIAGWTIGSNTLSSGDVYLSNDTNEKGLYISSSVNRLQVGEFNDYIPSPTTLSTGTRTETTSVDSKINGYISLDGFFLTSNTGSATDTASIFVPIIGTINQNDTVIVTQPVEFIGYSDRANLGFTYDSFTDSVTVEIVSGSSNTVVASSEAFIRPTPSNPNLPGASKTVQVSFFYTGSQALTSTGDLKAKITNTVDYNRTSTTGTLNRLVDINGLVVKKDTAVVNITNNQAFFYAGENRQFKWTPDELIFKGGELDITDLVVENVFVTSSNTNVIAVQAEDANQDGLLWGIAANGDPYFAPVSKSFYDFNSELRYDQSEERWQFDDELYVNGVLNGTTATFTGDLNAGDISGSTLESSGNTVVKGNLTVIGNTIISGSIDGHPVISPVASDSDSNTNGVVIQNLTVDAFGHLENIGTVDLDNRFVEKAGDTMTGNLILTDKLLSSQNNTDVDTGTEVVATVPIATYDAAFFDFVVKKTTNLRAGTVYAIHDGTNVEFTETSTQDLGDTSDVALSVDISGGNLRLNATTTSNDWSVKALVRGL